MYVSADIDLLSYVRGLFKSNDWQNIGDGILYGSAISNYYLNGLESTVLNGDGLAVI